VPALDTTEAAAEAKSQRHNSERLGKRDEDMDALNATPGKAGRPRKALDPSKVERLLQGIKLGLPFVHACARAGISEDTFARWRKQSADFAEAVKNAEAEAIARNVTLIQKAAGTSWQAAAWWLERRHPNDFARTERLQHGGL
jgi:hypothetical protein